MIARFFWCGSATAVPGRVAKSPFQAFSDPTGWREYGPILEWEMFISTASHSAEASVTLAIDNDLTPAQSDIASYGFGSINVGDHVFINDMESTVMPWGWVLIHGTVDKVDYQEHQVKVHFRNPMSWLADHRVRPGPQTTSDQLPVGLPYIHSLPNGAFRYEPNYTNGALPPWAILGHFIQFLCYGNFGGPFSSITLGPGVSGDGNYPVGTLGAPIAPNYMNTNMSILSASLEIARGTRWSSPSDQWGLEFVANPVPFGQGFSTDFFLFRRGFTSSGLIFDYTGTNGTHDIHDYSFPEQSLDVPTTGSGFGSGDITVPEFEVATKMAQDAVSSLGKWLGLIQRTVTTLDGPGRGKVNYSPAITTKNELTNNIIGNTPGIGAQKGFRVGSVKVGGFLNNFPLIPGYLATVNIPQIGLVNTTIVIDEFSYSEPEGVTTIAFNRSNADSLAGKIQAMQEQSNLIASTVTAKADSGWFKSDGNFSGPGLFDINPSLSAPARNNVSVVKSSDGNSTAYFAHQLGVSPSRVEVVAGVVTDSQADVDPLTITEVVGLNADIAQNQYFGGRIIRKDSFVVAIRLVPYLGYSEGLADHFPSAPDSIGWIQKDVSNSYLRIKVYP